MLLDAAIRSDIILATSENTEKFSLEEKTVLLAQFIGWYCEALMLFDDITLWKHTEEDGWILANEKTAKDFLLVLKDSETNEFVGIVPLKMARGLSKRELSFNEMGGQFIRMQGLLLNVITSIENGTEILLRAAKNLCKIDWAERAMKAFEESDMWRAELRRAGLGDGENDPIHQ